MKPSLAAFAVGLSMMTTVAAGADPTADARAVRGFLDRYCRDCHGKTDPEGNVSLDAISLASTKPGDIEIWKRVYDRVWDGQMPPLDVEQPRSSERQAALSSIKSRLKTAGMEFDELKDLIPSRGNWVDHDALFSGQIAGKADTPSRFWRLSPESYRQFFMRLGLGEREGLDPRFLSPWNLVWRWEFTDYSALHRVSEAEYEHHLRNCGVAAKHLRHRVHFAEVLKAGKTATPEQRLAAVVKTYDVILRLPLEPGRATSEAEYLGTLLESLDPNTAIEQYLVTVLCHPEVLYRIEAPDGGVPRGPMAPRHTARAISFALTDREPDDVLWQAAVDGQLATSTAVRAHVERILDDPAIPKPRMLGFFKEYFGYITAFDVAKSATLADEMQITGYDNGHFIPDTDRFVEWVLESDQDVLRTLLTSRKAFWRAREFKEFIKNIRWELGAKRHAAEAAEKQGKTADLTNFDKKLSELKRHALSHVNDGRYGHVYGIEHGIGPSGALVARPRTPAPDIDDWAADKPFDLHPEERIGILTHASWLVSMSSNVDNHVVHRGRWIRERLLGGRIPAIPITVNAVLPDEPHHGLRERMRATREDYCWKCHKAIDPLGLPFEQFDHFGRYRTREIVVDKERTDREQKKPVGQPRTMTAVPIDTTGAITDSGDPQLDGPVSGPFELMEKLARSQRVEQVFVRHVFRYFLGRNETLADGPTLVAAHKAYRDGKGSFKALLTSLLSSEPFLYRTTPAVTPLAQAGSR